MIRYTLKCDRDHVFDSWFSSADAFEKLRKTGMTTCAVCGSAAVEKTLMSPPVRPSHRAGPAPVPAPPARPGKPGPAPAQDSFSLSEPDSPLGRAIARLRADVEASSDYVGKDFVTQARAMHLGEVPERAIYGEARLDEARALAEDGVPVLPLPFSNRTKSN